MAGFHGHVRLAEGTASGCGNATGHFQQAVLPWASPRTGLLLDADRGAALFSLNGAFQGGCRLPQRPMWRAAMACVSTRYLRNDLQLIICSCDSPTITHYRRGFQIFFNFQTHYFQSHNWKFLVYIYLHSFQMLSKLLLCFSGKKPGFRHKTPVTVTVVVTPFGGHQAVEPTPPSWGISALP